MTVRKSKQPDKENQSPGRGTVHAAHPTTVADRPGQEHALLGLQRTHGNRFVDSLVRGRGEHPAAEGQHAPLAEASDRRSSRLERIIANLAPADNSGSVALAGGYRQAPPSASYRPDRAGLERNAEDEGAPEPDENVRRSLGDGGAGDAGPAAGPADAGVAAAPSASLTITGDGSYSDTASESRKNVRFNATWSGGNKEDYIIVNWLKGYLKKPDGTPFKVTMYGSSVDFNFADYQVDSIDEDPAYWSSGGVRWRYSVDGANKFSATDSPGPMYDSDGAGAKARVDFKTAVYKSSDVPSKTSGSLSATPLSSFQTWTYYVNVLGGGKFDHK